MSNTINFPNLEAVQKQAADWISAMDRGLSDGENGALQDWLSESPLHGETLVHYASAWDLMDILSPIRELLPLDAAVNSAKESKRRWFGWPVAAACASLLAIAVLLFMENSTPDPALKPLFTAVYQTEVGEQSEVVLPDQSRLKLNTGSRLKVTFSDQSRQVELISGEAYFEVAKNPQLPFVVIARDRAITAVGTAFNIELRDKQSVEVLVTEGKVAITDPPMTETPDSHVAIAVEQAVYLSGGQKIQLDGVDYGPVTPVEEFDLESSLAWQQGMIVFQGESLHQALAEISRYTAVDFKIIDDQIRDIEVGGYFKAGDTEQLLFVLGENFAIHSELEGNTWLLSRKTTP
ncbi:FecR domain-containing protein [Porticoccus sp. W117]|uniref:FecR family protein n=1 Tax=Porticoccus sp. W117 TaxID=3054777 RepID=UPI002592F5C8|nr:FecR domain-containing protein [Porticoccus sp. W117]MDM3870739.1 FecR domain-containing protein [Porticoccus sp. W117]